MPNKIKVGIVGYGNIGKGVEAALTLPRNDDLELVGIFSRRDPETLESKLGSTFFQIPNDKDEKYHELDADGEDTFLQDAYAIDLKECLKPYVDKINVMILCGGSAKEIPIQGPIIALISNTVDCYDNHDNMDNYFESMNEPAFNGQNIAIYAVGWDPGLLSKMRLLFKTILGATVNALYGLNEKGGLSMGHSDALRNITGVKDARQYTHAIHEAIGLIKAGENPELENFEKHWRECFVTLKNDTPEERERVSNEVLTMKGYFKSYVIPAEVEELYGLANNDNHPYGVKINFVTQEKLNEIDKDRGMLHDGVVIGVGKTASGKRAYMEFKCEWESNPESTAEIMIDYGRAAHKMYQKAVLNGRFYGFGAKNAFQVPDEYLPNLSSEEQRNMV